MEKNSKIFIAGAGGLVGSAIVRNLLAKGYDNLLTPSSRELDLTNQQATINWFESYLPDYVFLCAARVGGIKANWENPVSFIRDNLLIQLNVMDGCWRFGIKKTLFLGSSCIYPKHAPQPMSEDCLLSGKLEETNKPYAIAKIAGLTLCEAYNREEKEINFISAMPTNLYGPNDCFDPENSHVLPALIRKFHDAMPDESVRLWGTGKPKREFLHVNDVAEACMVLMEKYESSDPINIGTGDDIEIRKLADIVQEVAGHKGKIIWDTSMPDGTPRKLLDVSKIKSLGWEPKIELIDGIRKTYEWYKKQQE